LRIREAPRSTEPSPTSSTASVSTSSIFFTSPVSASSTSIQILSAYFGGVNVTAAASTVSLQTGNLVINTNDLSSALSINNSWQGAIQTLSILYSYGEILYIFTCVEQTGTYTITSSTIPDSAKVPTIATTYGASVGIPSLVWGALQI